MKVEIANKPIAGGYSFSASSEVLTLTSLAKDMSEPEYNNLVAEGTRVRELYIKGVAEAKAKGEKVSPSTIKANAVAQAKSELRVKIAEPNLEITEISIEGEAPTASTNAEVREKVGEAMDVDPLLQVLSEDESVAGSLDTPFVPRKMDEVIQEQAPAEMDFDKFIASEESKPQEDPFDIDLDGPNPFDLD